MERGTETIRGWVGCTQWANPILSIPAIVASNPGDFGQGRIRVDSTSASRFLPEGVALLLDLYEKRFSYNHYRKYRRVCQEASGDKRLRSF